jgi:hypothetical protein
VDDQEQGAVARLREKMRGWNPEYMILPPVEYDRYYEGNLTIRMVNTLEELRERCNAINPLMLACSFRYEKNCVIYLVEDSIMRKRVYTKPGQESGAESSS